MIKTYSKRTLSAEACESRALVTDVHFWLISKTLRITGRIIWAQIIVDHGCHIKLVKMAVI